MQTHEGEIPSLFQCDRVAPVQWPSGRAATRPPPEALAAAAGTRIRRMEVFRAWARRQGFCRAGLRCLAKGWSPEHALQLSIEIEDDGPFTVGRHLDVDGSRMRGDMSSREADTEDYHTVIASPEWAALFEGVQRG